MSRKKSDWEIIEVNGPGGAPIGVVSHCAKSELTAA